MSVSRIGSTSHIRRDAGSSGPETIAKQDARESKRNEKVAEVAKLYEKQFLGEMLKAMRGTVSFAEKQSMAEGIYRDQLDQEYIDAWGNQGGIGMSDLIYEQIMEKYFNTGSGQSLKKQGPIAISDRDVVSVSRVKSADPAAVSQVPLRIEVKPAPASTPAQVQAPWDSKVVSKSRVDGKTAVTLEHEGGLRSTVVFDGVSATNAETGSLLKKGQSLGTLNPDARSFLWNIKESRTSSLSGIPGLVSSSKPIEAYGTGHGVSADELAPIRKDNSRRPAEADHLAPGLETGRVLESDSGNRASGDTTATMSKSASKSVSKSSIGVESSGDETRSMPARAKAP